MKKRKCRMTLRSSILYPKLFLTSTSSMAFQTIAIYDLHKIIISKRSLTKQTVFSLENGFAKIIEITESLDDTYLRHAGAKLKLFSSRQRKKCIKQDIETFRNLLMGAPSFKFLASAAPRSSKGLT